MSGLAILVVILVVLVWRSIQKSKSQSLNIKESLLKVSASKEKQQKESTSSKEFKEKLMKFFSLYKSNIIDNAEFENQKKKLIASLADKDLTESKLDFILELSTLSSENILSKEDLSNIKNIIGL